MQADLARLDRHLPVLLGLMLLSLAVYAPPAGGAGEVWLFGGGLDPAVNVWCLNWWSFAAVHGLPLFHTEYVDAPAGADLAWRTAMPAFGLGLAPLIRLCGAVAVYNALMGLAGPLAGFATYLAARELAAGMAAPVAGGLLFAFMPYQMGQSLGHLDLAFSAPVPLGLFVILRAAKANWPPARLALVLGVLLAVEFGICQELFATAVLAGAALAFYPPLRRLAPGLIGGLLLATLLVSPLLWQMARDHPLSDQSPEPALYAADLLGFVVPTRLLLFGGQAAAWLTGTFTGTLPEQSAYLGLPLILLLAAIARRPGTGRSAVGAALVAGTLSLGPFLHVGGVAVSTAPWLAAYHVPLLHDMLPARFSLYVDLAVCLAVALWLARPGRWRFAVVALCALPLLPAQAVDRAWVGLSLPPAIAALPAGTGLVILPLSGQEMALQYLDGMRVRLVGQGYLGTGAVQPFAAWPLYAALQANDYAAIDPAALARYLATYRADAIAVLPSPDRPAAQTMLRHAGWRATTLTPQAIIYTPSGPPLAWSPPPPKPASPPSSLHRRLTFLSVLAVISALGVWADARFRARRADAPFWLAAVFLGWIVTLPAYIAVRLMAARRRPG